MKLKSTLMLILAALTLNLSAFAQLKTNLVFFTEQGEGFTLILNGIRQNPAPETNVKVTDLIAPTYKVKIIFDQQGMPDLDKTLTFNQGTETTFVIKRNNKNEYVMRWMNEVPIEQALPPATGQQVAVYNTRPPAPSTVTQTTTTYTETTGEPQGNVSMGISINDPELGVNMNINVGGAIPSGSQAVTTQTATTTYSTTTSASGGYYEEPVRQQPAPQQQAYIMPGYNGPVGCPYPMHPSEFQEVKRSIESKSFDDTRLAIARQVIAANCLLSAQVKEIMLLFTFEDTRLDLAKYAYGYTYDTGNYYKLNDAFTFDSSIEELDAYINGFRR